MALSSNDQRGLKGKNKVDKVIDIFYWKIRTESDVDADILELWDKWAKLS